MSDFFANVGGFRMPDVRMNQGPLPSVAGGPAGTDGTPDGVINGTNSLLSGITPYAYGEPARMGSDRNYQQIPHRVQYIVPPLYLPSQNSTTVHRVCHVVDNGDLAFVLMTRGRQWFGAGDTVMSVGPGTLPVFGNMDVVNYVLACLQLAPTRANAGGAGVVGKRSWTNIRKHMWNDFFDENLATDEDTYVHHMFKCVTYTVQHMLKPHGICAGSEYQGGQHEESWAPVQAAVNYTTTMTVDGQNRDLVNYWHEHGVYAGDRLMLRLVLVPRTDKEATREFQLTSYHERPVSAPVTTNQAYWQLQPWILHKDTEKSVDRFDYRVTGYWHIAQSFQGRQGSGVRHRVPQGAPLQVTFAPVFVSNGNVDDVEWDWFDLLEKVSREDILQSKQDIQNGGLVYGDLNTLAGVLLSYQVKNSTIQRTIRRPIWTAMRDDDRLICFANITSLYHFAKEIGSDNLKRRVVRRIEKLENKTTDWNGMSGDAIEIEVDDFLREVLGNRFDAFHEYISSGRLTQVNNSVDTARRNVRTNGKNGAGSVHVWAFQGLRANAGVVFGAGSAEAGGGVLGADVRVEGADVCVVGASADSGVEVARKPKKKRASAFVEDMAVDIAAKDGCEARE